MSADTVDTNSNAAQGLTWRAVAPAALLIVLSPIMAELLMGATTLSRVWLMIPEMGVYGVGALLIREVTRRRGRGWGMILLLGFAFSLAEECVILQTSLEPQFSHFAASFGWVSGVQWIWLAAMLWYEAVYAIVLPIYLVGIIFPDRRDQPWLPDRALPVAAGAFVVCSVGVWYLWNFFGLQAQGGGAYQVPLAGVGIALLVIAVLVAAGLSLKPRAAQPEPSTRKSTWPWLVGLLAFGFGLSWFVMIALPFVPTAQLKGASPAVPVVAGAVWAGVALLVVRGLTHTRGWSDRHRLALITGAMLASMLGGFLTVAAPTVPPIDRIGKVVLDLIAVILLILLIVRVRRGARVPAA